MTREEYKNTRSELDGMAELHIEASELGEAEKIMKEIKDLDASFDNEIKAAANLRALADNPVAVDISKNSVDVPGATIIESFGAVNNHSGDISATIEYRQAFMNHVVRGQAMPAQFLNVDATTVTTDIGALIPATVVEKIVEKLEATGMILPLVTRTSIKGGVSIPYATAKPTATWVAEGAGSDKQKKALAGTITFAYHKLRCAVAVSLESDTMSLPIFESNLISNITEAMLKAVEQAIISGNGIGQPKGILAETPATGQALSASALSYDLLIQAESALPIEYEDNAAYCMTKKTFMAYQGIVDESGQPVARVNYGISGKPERSLLGRPVVLVNYLPSFSATLAADTIFAFIFNFSDYLLNTNYNMGIKRYEDNDTDDQIMKSIMLVDGKVVDKNSLVTIKKVAA